MQQQGHDSTGCPRIGCCELSSPGTKLSFVGKCWSKSFWWELLKSVTDRYELEFFYRFCNKLKQLRNSGNFHLGPMADKIEPCDEEAEAGEGDF